MEPPELLELVEPPELELLDLPVPESTWAPASVPTPDPEPELDAVPDPEPLLPPEEELEVVALPLDPALPELELEEPPLPGPGVAAGEQAPATIKPVTDARTPTSLAELMIRPIAGDTILLVMADRSAARSGRLN